jgi:hypothetical protein
MKERMTRRGFFSRSLLLLFSAIAAGSGLGGDKPDRIRAEKTSRRRADHWRELAG